MKRVFLLICSVLLLLFSQMLISEREKEHQVMKTEQKTIPIQSQDVEVEPFFALPPQSDVVIPQKVEEIQFDIVDVETDLLQDQPLHEDESPIYYLALGDSLTKGVGDEENKKGYTKRLVEKIEQWTLESKITLDNRGKRGRRSDQLLSLLKKGHYDIELKNAELITITIGGNDLMKIVKKDLFDLKKETFDNELIEFKERYDEIIREIRLRNKNVPIILIGLYNPITKFTGDIPELEAIVTEWNQAIFEISEENTNACFVNVQDLFDENTIMVYHSDFFHPNGNGYTLITERILSKMNECHLEVKPEEESLDSD
ncbi:lysophospholipase L1-like esterase [Lysinibacillus composti]|uniref:Lysophospholipase n=1 Tax=Lysinibacillus composti TaxID=720633 RepID=A0A3N9UTL7_9BACI|nr:GDSL-type esterase/lipase family protein [Lysinibacillus composti]MBM7607681.1 lysophospholipase L1-like esterase [Lysinibacillus composti]RQW75822.1 lysophospholipase [Lysinibacillus composti]